MTTKTKAELIEEWAQEDCQADSVSQPRTCPEQYYKMGALRAFEHADKEIAEAYERGRLAASNEHDLHMSRVHSEAEHEAHEWWAERWAAYRGIIESAPSFVQKHFVLQELDARAKEVLEGE